MLQNAFGGLQGIVDHVMVGNFVGFTGNAAIGVSWQIFLVVMVFVSSLFSGMAVLVARFAGADEPEKVNRTVAQAMITAAVLSVAVLAPIGWFAAPWLLDLVNAQPAVQAEALAIPRLMFVASLGMMLFFMVGGALRAAGDAQTPLRLGIALTRPQHRTQPRAHSGMGSDSATWDHGRRDRHHPRRHAGERLRDLPFVEGRLGASRCVTRVGDLTGPSFATCSDLACRPACRVWR